MTLVTIILPTRNRADTLVHALRTLTRIDDDRLEILVSDNASDDGTREVVAAENDPRLRYINPGRRLGMSQHWEFALEQARGDWLGFMGDDDGMLPDALSRLRAIVAETGAEAVRAEMANYTWPSLSGREVGVLHLPVSSGTEVRGTGETLRKVLEGRVRYTQLPVLYNGGFASRQAIERAKFGSGRFFHSRIPDIYSGVALAATLDRFVWSNQPMAVNGASAHSTGTATFTKSTEGARLQPGRLFLAEDNLPFHPAVPLGPDASLPRSLQVLVLESWHQVRDMCPDITGLAPEAQLRAIIRSADHEEAVAAWARDFAALHGLETALAKSGRPGSGRSPGASWLGRAWSREWHSGLAPAERITNVADATRLAAQVLASSPSEATLPVKNLLRIARKGLARVTRPNG